MNAITKTTALILVVVVVIAVTGIVLYLSTRPPTTTPIPTQTTTTPITTPTTTPTKTETTTTPTTTLTTPTTPTTTTPTKTPTTPPPGLVKITIGDVEVTVPREFADFVEKAKKGEVKVAIYFGHAFTPEEREGFLKAIDKFMKAYPGVEVKEIRYGGMSELQGQISAIASIPPEQREQFIGSIPEVFTWAHDWIGWFADAGWIIPLDDIIGSQAYQDIYPHILGTAMAAVTYRGKAYGLPYAGEAIALFVNTKLVSTPPKTFDEMKAIMEQYYNPDIGTYGVAIPGTSMYHINAWVTAYGGFFYDEATKELGFTKPETAEGIKFFIANIYRYVNVLAGVDHTTQRNLFGEGKTPFYISGPWDVSYAVKTFGVGNFTVVQLPKIGDKVPKPFAGFRNLYITNMAIVGAKERQYAVALFILYIALDNDAIITLVNECGYVPVKNSVAEYIIQHSSENPLYPVIIGFFRQLVNAVPMPKDKNMQSVWGADTPLGAIWQAYANKLQETKSVDQAVEAAVSVVDQALRDAYNQVAPKIEK